MGAEEGRGALWGLLWGVGGGGGGGKEITF